MFNHPWRCSTIAHFGVRPVCCSTPFKNTLLSLPRYAVQRSRNSTYARYSGGISVESQFGVLAMHVLWCVVL